MVAALTYHLNRWGKSNVTTAEEREKEWWGRWREEDFSWNGLAKLRTKSGMTLQTYWRAEERNLYNDPTDTEGKRRYTRFHMPLAWSDGTPTEKETWTQDEYIPLQEELELRLRRALDRGTEADFRGVVLHFMPSMPAAQSRSDQDNEKARTTGAAVDFSSSWLRPSTKSTTKVFGPCVFNNTAFIGEALFRRTTFLDAAQFNGATFCGVGSFSNASFYGTASFDRASFYGDALFSNTTFFGDAKFDGVTFSKDMCFEDVDFFGDARFEDATFSGDTQFDDATFSGDARFDDATFNKRASFSGTTFNQHAAFGSAAFSGDARFDKATFSKFTWFGDATFSGDVWFDEARFDQLGAGSSRLYFQRATFSGSCQFPISVMPADARYARRAFHSARFEGNLYTELNKDQRKSLDGLIPFPLGAFDGALFKELVFLDKDYAARKKEGIPEFVQQQIDSTKALSSEEREDNLLSIAEGARVLQIAMAKGRNNDAEQMFHKIELIAMRETRAPRSPLRLLTDAYERTSDFGGSMTRPLGWTIGVALACAFFFWLWQAPANLECLPVTRGLCHFEGQREAAVSSLTFSTRNVVRPFHVWAIPPGRGTSFEDVLLYGDNKEPGVGGFVVRLVSTLQSFFSIVMLFLTALAARRRFQLS